jgi:carbon starvation protein CstA
MGSKKDAYSYLVTSMLITSPKMASHVASTTPTALIARLQLLALKEYIGSKQHVIVSFTISDVIQTKTIAKCSSAYKVFNFQELFKDAQSCQ